MKVFAIVLCLALAGSALASQRDIKLRNNRDDSENSAEDTGRDRYIKYNMNGVQVRDNIDWNRVLCNSCILLVNGTKFLVEEKQQTIDFLSVELIRLIRNGPCPYWKEYLENFVINFGELMKERLENSTAQQICLDRWAPCRYGEIDMAVSFSFMCPVCTGVMGGLKLLVSNGIVQTALITAAHVACSAIPFVSGTCNGLIDQYGDQLFEWLQDYSPSKVCSLMHVC